MVKLRAFAAALSASGQLADALQLQRLPSGVVLSTRRTPTQPRTEAQQATRVLVAFLSAQWRNIETTRRASWDPIRIATNTTLYHAYLSHNIKRYADLHTPTQLYPAPETELTAYWTFPTATGGKDSVRIETTFTAANANWGLSYHHNLGAPVTLARANLVNLLHADKPGPHPWTHQHLDPGEHYYKVWRFATDGRHAPTAASIHATVTG